MSQRPRMLPVTLAIGPNRHPQDQVKDAEAFCRTYLDEAMRRNNMDLRTRPEDYDDSLQLLIAVLWRLNTTFREEANTCFADYARTIIRKRAYDVCPRRLLGRTGNRKPDYLHDQLDESTPGNRHLEALPQLTSDEDPHSRPTLGRLPDPRDRHFAWAAAVLGIRTPPAGA